MTRLLHDRYLACDGRRAWDLATGQVVQLAGIDRRVAETQAANGFLIEVLDHGRDGEPRWIRAEPGAATSIDGAIHRAASDARARGFVPLSVDAYLRLGERLAEDLENRTLMLIARPTSPLPVAHQALVEAAARSPRPHVLVSFPSKGKVAGFAVREAPAAYGRPAGMERVSLHGDVAQHVARAQRATEFVRAGCHAAAERLLRDVAAALMRRRALEPAVRTLTTLGRLHLERGRAAEADHTFEEAAAAAREARADVLGLEARIWQALARTDAGRLTAAESILRAVLLSPTLPSDRKAWAEAALARVLLWQHRLEESDALDAAPVRRDGLDPVAAASVTATTVRLLVARQRIFEAGQLARQGLLAAEGSPDPVVGTIAAMAQLRVLCAAGDLAPAEACLMELTRQARTARAFLRVARAQLLWADTLRRSGRAGEAAAALRRLSRVRRAVPPLLRSAIDRRLAGRPTLESAAQVAAPSGTGARAAALIRIAGDEEADVAAVRAVLTYVAEALRTSRLDLVSAEAGPVTTLLTIGTGVPTTLGQRVLEAGITIGPEPGDPGREVGVPLRVGQRVGAALVARWAMDTTRRSEAGELLELAAAVAAPRAEAMLAGSREAAAAATAVPELVGIGAVINDVRKAIARAAAAPFAVLIEGESGVGKELVARAIHQLGPRRARRFCDVNCAALPEELLESELFGHARGAFTGAVADRPGLFEEADGGTVFLDEIADLSPRAQAKLLRVLQQHEVRRVGEGFSRPIDVRVVSAANRELRAEAGAGRFRQDLLYRLDVIRIRVPPLRERPEDIPRLTEHFWRAAALRVGTAATLTHGVIAALARYHWPGNVRELQNVVAALAVAAPARGRVRASLLPSVVTGATATSSTGLTEARAQFERRFIEVALARAGGSRTRAARAIGLSRQGLLKMILRLGVPEAK